MTSIRFALFFLPASLGAAPFATQVISFSGLGQGIYGDPNAILGPPTRWVRDTVNGGPLQRVSPSIGYAAWNVTPSGQPTICTINPGGHVTVEFDPPITNQLGEDFIVFGNSIIACSETLGANTDLNAAFILSGPDFIEPMAISVSNDGLIWSSFPLSPTQAADGYWPTQAFDANGRVSNFNLPVPSPKLRRTFLTGLSAMEAIKLFRGSGGGTAFDLSRIGFRGARFVRVDGNGGEVDAFARVIRPTPQRP